MKGVRRRLLIKHVSVSDPGRGDEGGEGGVRNGKGMIYRRTSLT